MSKLSIFIGGIVFSCLNLNHSYAGQPIKYDYNAAILSCQHYLIAAGIENIQIQIARQQTIWIAYENRRYRNEVTALGIVLGYVSECFNFVDHFVLVPKYRNVPLKYIQVDREQFQQFLRGETAAAEFLDCLKLSYHAVMEQPLAGFGSHNAESSLFKFDLVASPGVKVQFARPDDPAQLQFNWLSDLSFTMADGLQLNGQWVVPLYNEFQHRESRSRLGRLYLNQFLRLPGTTFLTISAGLFDYGCSGTSAQIKRFFWKDRLGLAVRLDYLNTPSLNQWLQCDAPGSDRCSYLLQVHYRFEQINFETKLTWGRYLLSDEGWRIDIVRTFHELQLGFMGVWDKSLELLTGMTISLPFPISRQPQPGRFRIGGPRYVPWNYRYLPCFNGFILDTGDEFEEIARQLSKSFIRANIHQLKHATRYVKLNEPAQWQRLFAEGGK